MPTDYAIAASTDPTTGQVKRNAGMMQAYALRQLAFDLARQIGGAKPCDVSEELRAQANATTQLIRAWAEADERARIARGRPLPGSLRPERKLAKRKPRASGPVAPPISPVREPTHAHEGPKPQFANLGNP